MAKREEFVEEFRIRGEQVAEAHGEAEMLEHRAKRIFAQIVIASDKSVARAEYEAAVDPRYCDAKEAAIEAKTKANKLRAQLNAMEVSYELFRTESATNRAQMNLR